jgi:geranylgeranyl pyrophosphate synthase
MTALSQTFAEEAKEQLMLLPRSSASEFLENLTDFTIYRKS